MLHPQISERQALIGAYAVQRDQNGEKAHGAHNFKSQSSEEVRPLLLRRHCHVTAFAIRRALTKGSLRCHKCTIKRHKSVIQCSNINGSRLQNIKIKKHGPGGSRLKAASPSIKCSLSKAYALQ
jgi:hypothetical protein